MKPSHIAYCKVSTFDIEAAEAGDIAIISPSFRTIALMIRKRKGPTIVKSYCLNECPQFI
jgi:hypothetical protein